MKKISKLTFVSLISGIMIWYTFNQVAAQIEHAPVASSQSPRFKGTLLIASDADQIGTAYADGIINKVKGIEDSLTLLQWDQTGKLQKSQLHVSNSVISWPSIIAHSPDRRYAYVVETRGIYRGQADKLKNVWEEMPSGNLIQVLDLKNPQKPQLIQQKAIGLNPKTVSVNAQGDLVLVASEEKGKEIVLGILKDGLLDRTFTFEIKGLERKGSNGGVNAAEFHPKKDIIAVLKDNRSVEFYRVLREGDLLKLQVIGSSIEAGKVISVGNFTPDGKYFIVSDVQWGDSSLGNVFNNKGYLVSVRFDEAGQHKIINKAKVGLSPEGFDISPDGRRAVVVNMRRTYLPKGFPYVLFAARKLSSLSLVKIDPETGELQTVGDEYGFEGELPEDAVFDASGQSIAVAIFNERFEAFPKQGFIEFWSLKDDRFIRTALKIPVTRGCHNLKLLP